MPGDRRAPRRRSKQCYRKRWFSDMQIESLIVSNCDCRFTSFILQRGAGEGISPRRRATYRTICLMMERAYITSIYRASPRRAGTPILVSNRREMIEDTAIYAGLLPLPESGNFDTTAFGYRRKSTRKCHLSRRHKAHGFINARELLSAEFIGD